MKQLNIHLYFIFFKISINEFNNSSLNDNSWFVENCSLNPCETLSNLSSV